MASLDFLRAVDCFRLVRCGSMALVCLWAVSSRVEAQTTTVTNVQQFGGQTASIAIRNQVWFAEPIAAGSGASVEGSYEYGAAFTMIGALVSREGMEVFADSQEYFDYTGTNLSTFNTLRDNRDTIAAGGEGGANALYVQLWLRETGVDNTAGQTDFDRRRNRGYLYALSRELRMHRKLTATIATTTTNMSAQLTAQQASLTSINTAVGNLPAMRTSLTSLVALVSDTNTQVGQVYSRLGTTNATLDAIDTKLSGSNTRLDTANSYLSDIASELDSVKADTVQLPSLIETSNLLLESIAINFGVLYEIRDYVTYLYGDSATIIGLLDTIASAAPGGGSSDTLESILTRTTSINTNVADWYGDWRSWRGTGGDSWADFTVRFSDFVDAFGAGELTTPTLPAAVNEDLGRGAEATYNASKEAVQDARLSPWTAPNVVEQTTIRLTLGSSLVSLLATFDSGALSLSSAAAPLASFDITFTLSSIDGTWRTVLHAGILLLMGWGCAAFVYEELRRAG